MDKQVEKLMKNLNISEAEARLLIEDDKRIDRGEELFSLNAEQEKASKEARNVGRAPTVYKFEQKKERKADEVKRSIINRLMSVISGEICVINPEREFTFFEDNKKYKITLSCPRN